MPTGPELPPLPDHLKAMVRKSEPREFEGFPPETTTPPADRDDLAAILAEHEWCKYGVPSQPPRWWPMCSCGESFRNLRYDEAFDAHRAHVAQMVLESDWLRGVKAQAAQDERDRMLKPWPGEWVIHDGCDDAPEVRHYHVGTRCPHRADRVDAEDGGR